MSDHPLSLDLRSLRGAYAAGRITPAALVEILLERIDAYPDKAVWIHLGDRQSLLEAAQRLADADRSRLPLFGIPFAVKDNIDVAGMPTSAACPEFTYLAERSAFVVQRLQDAGALVIGKTNLDQFATGLVGVRSPFGAPRSPFDPCFISGGSSSGSAVAVSAGLVSFALGTDTAGSGRVPAAFNNLIGLKPSRGLFSMTGVVPACRSLDCPSVFALTADDAADVWAVAAAADPSDPFGRTLGAPLGDAIRRLPEKFRFGVPNADQLQFFDQAGWRDLFAAAVARLESLGGTAVTVDYQPFAETARLLYEGPWVAERTAAVGAFLAAQPAAGHPVVRRIVEGGDGYSAVQTFRALYRLEELRKAVRPIWSDIDVLITPTAPATYSVAAVEADPVALNSRLGLYTNFMNLLDMAGLAVPAGFGSDGLPFGVTLSAPAMTDGWLLSLGDALHRAGRLPLGATGKSMPDAGPREFGRQGYISCAVVGAHLEGLPLHHQITERRGRLQVRTTSAPAYRLFLLDQFTPIRPGLIRQSSGGAAIDLEVWDIPASEFGGFVAGIPAPLSIGKVELADGRMVTGFLCEPHAAAAAPEITAHGGWRRWLAATGR